MHFGRDLNDGSVYIILESFEVDKGMTYLETVLLEKSMKVPAHSFLKRFNDSELFCLQFTSMFRQLCVSVLDRMIDAHTMEGNFKSVSELRRCVQSIESTYSKK